MEYKNKKINNFIFTALLFVTLLSAINISAPIRTVQAQTPNTGKTYTLLEPLPCLGGTGSGCTTGTPITTMDLNGFFQYAFNLLIGLAGVSAVFMMVWGGFLYMTADAWTQKSEGKEKFTNAIKGLLMVLAAFLILKTVNPKLVAIPKEIGLIKLENGLNRDKPTDFFDQLDAESKTYKLNNQQAISNLKSARGAESQLLDQRLALDTQLGEAEQAGNDSEIDNLNTQISNNEDLIRINRSTVLAQQAAMLINQDLISMTSGANETVAGGLTTLLQPDLVAGTEAGKLQSIASATKNIYGTLVAKNNTLSTIQNSQTPTILQTLNKEGDDALLRATQIYVETYKNNKPETDPGTLKAIKDLYTFKNSFALSDPQKNSEKNKLLIDLCKSEATSIGEDPNQCK